MDQSPTTFAQSIYQAAKPVIKIFGVGGRQWRRNVAKGARIGPWLQGEYRILDEVVWRRKAACLYLVAGNDGDIRYVGISRNGLKHRWRTSPAYDATTNERLPKNQLFHSQCWKFIERESKGLQAATFEVRCISAEEVLPVLARLGPPLSAFTALKDDAESVVASLERWICNNCNGRLATWNIAMTRA
jgi:hypothetical protein